MPMTYSLKTCSPIWSIAALRLKKERAEINAYKQEIQQLKDELKTKSDRLDERRDKILRKANEEAAAI
mgnify:CR=1 FL=1